MDEELKVAAKETLKKRGMPKLTKKQRAFLAYYLGSKGEGKMSFDGRASVMAAGYRCKSDDVAAVIATENLRTLKPYIDQFWELSGLSTDKIRGVLMTGVFGGMACKKTIFFQHQGAVTETHEVIDRGLQAKYVEMAMKYKGMFAPDRIEHSGPGGGPIQSANLNVDLKDFLKSEDSVIALSNLARELKRITPEGDKA
jgi:hypothetical protein